MQNSKMGFRFIDDRISIYNYLFYPTLVALTLPIGIYVSELSSKSTGAVYIHIIFVVRKKDVVYFYDGIGFSNGGFYKAIGCFLSIHIEWQHDGVLDRKSTRLNSSHVRI